MRGKKWEKDVDIILIERYTDTPNDILSRETGYGLRTIERHAHQLGLHKSHEFMMRKQRLASIEAKRWFEYQRLIGKKIYKKRYSGKMFEKGRIPEPEIEKKRIEALRQLAWEERRRIIHGFQPKTKWRFDKTLYDKYKEKKQ